MPNDSDFKADIIQKTAAQWTALNPFLNMNDLGIESDTSRQKVGVGKKWSDTSYLTPAGHTGQVIIDDLNRVHTLTFTNGFLTGYSST